MVQQLLRPSKATQNLPHTVQRAAPQHKPFRMWLRERREHLALTQLELVKLSGVSMSTIAKLEHGVHSPSPWNLRKLAPALRVTHEQIQQAAEGKPVEVSDAETGLKQLPPDVAARLAVLGARTMQAPDDLLRTALAMLELAYRR